MLESLAASRTGVTAGNAARGSTPGLDEGLLVDVDLRRFPYPYRAILAICSDLDETPDRDLYLETLRFLNSRNVTRFGMGLGLEVGNTMYFDMPAGQFSYWNTDDRGRAAIRALMRSGHIDCLHSFGDLADTRAHAGRALDDLARHDCHLSVWIDHAVAPSNFGADIMRGQGDVRGAAAYHADLTTSFGVKYVWRGRVTSVTAQDVPRDLRGIFTPTHPVASALTLAKETSKGLLARFGNAKYRMHAGNRVLEASQLRDGHPVMEFLRTNPHWGGVSSAETATGIGDVLVSAMLDRLLDRGGASILYTHLGKTRDVRRPFSTAGVAALRQLADRDREGHILVTTTRRLLGYANAAGHIGWTARRLGECLHIDVTTTASAGMLNDADLDGLTFYVPDPAHTSVSIDGQARRNLQCNSPDLSGRPSVSVPWRRLTFPSV